MGIFLDISKAFDTIDHAILLHKLNNYGVRGRPISFNWFKSYLSYRFQIVEYAGVTSSNQMNTFCSAPQGSILAPLLFIIYVNDFKNFKILLLMTQMFLLSIKNFKHFMKKETSNLENIDNWMIANKLSINTNKTNYILFQTPKSRLTKTV